MDYSSADVANDIIAIFWIFQWCWAQIVGRVEASDAKNNDY
jgi:hypothetical protein